MTELSSDRELVRRCVDGDAGAWEDLVRRHAGLLYRTARKVLAGYGAADGEVEDVVQHVFLKLWTEDRRRLRTWEGKSRLSTWLVAVARREALDRLKQAVRRTRRVTALNGGLPEALSAALSEGSAERLETDETAREVHEAVDRLPERDRLLVRLVYFDGVSYRDAARVLDVPLNSISPWLARARGRLATLLGRAGNGSL